MPLYCANLQLLDAILKLVVPEEKRVFSFLLHLLVAGGCFPWVSVCPRTPFADQAEESGGADAHAGWQLLEAAQEGGLLMISLYHSAPNPLLPYQIGLRSVTT